MRQPTKLQLLSLIERIEGKLSDYQNSRHVCHEDTKFFAFFPITAWFVMPIHVLFFGGSIFRDSKLTKEKLALVATAKSGLQTIKNNMVRAPENTMETQTQKTLKEINDVLFNLRKGNGDLHAKYQKSHRTYQPIEEISGCYNDSTLIESLLSRYVNSCSYFVEQFSNSARFFGSNRPGSVPTAIATELRVLT